MRPTYWKGYQVFNACLKTSGGVLDKPVLKKNGKVVMSGVVAKIFMLDHKEVPLFTMTMKKKKLKPIKNFTLNNK